MWSLSTSHHGLSITRSLLVMLQPPSQRYCFSEVLGDEHGGCVDLLVNGSPLYCEESPAFTQPDLMVDRATGNVVGFRFDLLNSNKQFSHWSKLLQNLDRNRIRLSSEPSASLDESERDFLEVTWGDATDSEEVFAQLDYGSWAFLYPSRSPQLADDTDSWTVPVGFIIPDVKYLKRPVALFCDGNIEAEILVP